MEWQRKFCRKSGICWIGVEVVFAAEPPAGSVGAFRLSAFADDTGVVMPYSQFSYAADCAEGVVAVTSGLALRFPISSGEHHVFLGSSTSGFSITITLAQHSLAPFTDDLPLTRATGASSEVEAEGA